MHELGNYVAHGINLGAIFLAWWRLNSRIDRLEDRIWNMARERTDRHGSQTG